jgi:hypothetical protein
MQNFRILLILIFTLKWIMKQKYLLLLFLWWIIPALAFSQNKKIPKEFCITAQAKELFTLINHFRIENKLNEIPLSASLSYVASIHLNDLMLNHADTVLCNLHSWSDKGEWTACCYQAYIPIQDCMWDKPKELSPYKYRGYELAFYQEGNLTAQEILDAWLEIPEAKQMILNQGKWDNIWRALGVDIRNNYALLWFGRAKDNEPAPIICGKEDETTKKKEKNIDQKTGRFYLIFGSFKKLKDAERKAARYIKAGFSEIQILSSENTYRISLSSHLDLKSAKEAKSKLEKKYAEAWILKF